MNNSPGDFIDYEESFLSQDRKHYRKERKRVSAKDRSKFKKTDQDQRRKWEKEELISATAKEGRVLAIRPEGIVVGDGTNTFLCSLRGSLKKEKNLIKNLIAIGDRVLFEKKEKEGVILQVLSRSSILSRADNLSRKKEQLIATNVDQVFITLSVIYPPLKLPLIDRYIIAARKGNLIPILLINKIDLLENPPSEISKSIIEEEKKLLEEILKIYPQLSIPVILISTKTGIGLEEVKKKMEGKTSVFSGQSGVGKSSIINAITGSFLVVGDIVEKTKKGTHTTTHASLIPLEKDSFCVDTPGVRSFGLWDLNKQDIKDYFEDFKPFATTCRFPNCQHLEEPDCKVKKAVERKKISPLRFESYCALMSSLSEEHRHR